MTLLQMYNTIAGFLYGDIAASPPPVHEIATIQTLILAKHRESQIGYNYWFQKVITTYPLLAGIDTYAWPVDFKEYVSLDLDSSMEFTADGFRLETVPTADETKDFTYWSILQAPVVWDDAFEDNASIYLVWFIIYSVVGDLMLKRSSQEEASSYYQLAEQAKYKTEQEDFQRRQAPGLNF
jgi:hypothetical protein